MAGITGKIENHKKLILSELPVNGEKQRWKTFRILLLPK